MKEFVCGIWFYYVLPYICLEGTRSFFAPNAILGNVFGIIAIISVWWAGFSALEYSKLKERQKIEEKIREQEEIERLNRRNDDSTEE